FSVFWRDTDYDKINIARYSTNSFGGAMNFGYPLSETQRLGFSLGYTNLSVKYGDSAVQEIIGSPRAIQVAPGSDFSVEIDGVTYLDRYCEVLREDGYCDEADAQDGLYDLDLLSIPQDGFVDIHGDKYNNFALTGSWVQSTLNRGQMATRGASQSFAVQLAFPGSDVQHYKFTYNAQKYFPLGRLFTIRVRGELGYGDGYGDTEALPFYENFYSGGFGSVRGFKANTLGPRATPAQVYAPTAVVGLVPDPTDPDQENPTLPLVETFVGSTYVEGVCIDQENVARCVQTTANNERFGGNVLIEGGIELIFPLPFIKDQRSLRSTVFIDAGNVFSTDCLERAVGCFDVDAGELRYSIGIGLTWISGFGPLTFSLAKPFNEGPFDSPEVFQFSLGQVF
ncbi:MAG: BamA/TamA family outer membrane protein, partial [Pseudomonadales bacterium]